MIFLKAKDIQKLFRKTGRKTKSQRKRYNREESQLVKACLEYLNFKGYLAFRVNAGFIFLDGNNGKRAIKLSVPGTPDIIACSPRGQFVAIECKSSKGKLTEKQKKFLGHIEKVGGKALVIRSIDDLLSSL